MSKTTLCAVMARLGDEDCLSAQTLFPSSKQNLEQRPTATFWNDGNVSAEQELYVLSFSVFSLRNATTAALLYLASVIRPCDMILRYEQIRNTDAGPQIRLVWMLLRGL